MRVGLGTDCLQGNASSGCRMADLYVYLWPSGRKSATDLQTITVVELCREIRCEPQLRINSEQLEKSE
jgi:hypothetical protein